MNRIILDEEQKRGHENIFVVHDSAIREHIVSHLKAKIGSQVKVAVLNRGLTEAVVVTLTDKEIHLKIGPLSPGAPQPFQLLIAASRPPTVKKIIEHGTSMGVQDFVFFKADLSEKSYLTSKVFEEKSVHQLTTLGLSQGAVYVKRPKVTVVDSLSEAVKLAESDRYMLSLEGEKSFLDSFPSEKVSLAIGPERGWTQKEEEFLENQEFTKVLIGPSVLRVEIATFSALGQLAMIRTKS
ncbi:MAG: RsmE family RNA methyltransferase [Bacteriovoracaceae bacterium]|nr:RsmE family RNA methyltransferase [Bacteriovoracaceae bacterium]